MGKTGKEKNTKNKAKHSKHLARKKNKIKADKQQHKARLKEIVQKANENEL